MASVRETVQPAMLPLPGGDGRLYAAARTHVAELQARGLLGADDLDAAALMHLAIAADRTPGGDAAAKLGAELLEELAGLPTGELEDDALDELLAAALEQLRAHGGGL